MPALSDILILTAEELEISTGLTTESLLPATVAGASFPFTNTYKLLIFLGKEKSLGKFT